MSSTKWRRFCPERDELKDLQAHMREGQTFPIKYAIDSRVLYNVFFSGISLALGQPYDRPNSSESNWKVGQHTTRGCVNYADIFVWCAVLKLLAVRPQTTRLINSTGMYFLWLKYHIEKQFAQIHG